MRADKSLSPFEIRVYHHYRTVHGIRVALAFVLTFLLTRLLNIPESTWALVTTVVIMAPISFWGNVVSRAIQRAGGTILGSIYGLIALQLELYSLPLMLVWCAAAMFLCGWLALGKKPYQALLIGVTLAIVVGAPTGNMDVALWRSGDVILGSLLAIIFTGIWPQRAFMHWRIKSATFLTDYNRLYQTALSPNLIERPRLDKQIQELLNEVVKMRALLAPASKETGIPKSILEAIHTINRNLVCMLELQINAYWATRASHFVLLNAPDLRQAQSTVQQTLLTIVHTLYDGQPQTVFANTEKLNETAAQLRQLIEHHHALDVAETPIHGYVWLSMETARQLELLSHLISRALRK